MHKPTPIYVRIRGQRFKKSQRRDAKRLFIQNFIQTLNVTKACALTGIARSCFYNWLSTDAKFRHKYEAIGAVFFWCHVYSEEDIQRGKELAKAGRQYLKTFYYYHPDIEPPAMAMVAGR